MITHNNTEVKKFAMTEEEILQDWEDYLLDEPIHWPYDTKE